MLPRRFFGLVAFFFLVGDQLRDEDTETFVHLRRGKSRAVVLEHRGDHVVDQGLECPARHLRRRHGLRLGAEDGVTHPGNFQNGHEY